MHEAKPEPFGSGGRTVLVPPARTLLKTRSLQTRLRSHTRDAARASHMGGSVLLCRAGLEGLALSFIRVESPV